MSSESHRSLLGDGYPTVFPILTVGDHWDVTLTDIDVTTRKDINDRTKELLDPNGNPIEMLILMGVDDNGQEWSFYLQTGMAIAAARALRKSGADDFHVGDRFSGTHTGILKSKQAGRNDTRLYEMKHIPVA